MASPILLGYSRKTTTYQLLCAICSKEKAKRILKVIVSKDMAFVDGDFMLF